MRAQSGAALTAAFAVMCAAPAGGQSLSSAASRAPANTRDVQDTVYDQTVAARSADRNSDAGFPLGAFTIRPVIDGESSLTDNLYATNSDRRSDLYFTVDPEITAQADQAHSAIAARLYYSRSIHARYSTEDASSYGGSLDTRYDLAADTRLSINALANREVESRSSLGSFRQASRPARFTQVGGQAILDQAIGQFGLSLIGRAYRLTYSDALINNVEVSQRYRNFDIYSGAIQGGYSINHITDLIARVTVDLRRYDLRPGDVGFDPVTQTDRNADGIRIEGGLSRQITSLVSLVVRAGYLHYNYADPRLLDVSSFSYFGSLLWNVTPLTTISASAERRLDETTSPLTAGNLRDEVRASVDHELLRTLIVGGSLRYARINPAGLSPSSREFSAIANARYRMGRHVDLTLNLLHDQRTSQSSLIAFRENRVTIGVRYAR